LGPELSATLEPGNRSWYAGALMFNALRYYWIIAKGYRLRPWQSPYIRWRMETFFGHEAGGLNAGKFFRLMWGERARLTRFLGWVAQRRTDERAAK